MSKTKIFALGGIEEVGKNTYCIEHNDEIIIIDAGIKFPNKFFLGVEIIIPDYQYLVKNKKKIRGLFITHGHEDHIGGIPYLIKATNLKNIYSPAFASDLIKMKLKKQKANLITYKTDSVIKFKYFTISFFAITHSIPKSFGIVVQTPNGRVVYTGDFKLDWTPLGQKTEIHKIAQIGESGVDLLLSDSTNSEIPGFTLTEKVVIANITKMLVKYPERIFITTFASNMNRIIQIILAAEKAGRKVLILGKAIEKILNIVKEKAYFKINFDILIKITDLKKYSAKQILIICTGSQGEGRAIITKLAHREHPEIDVIKNDLFIFSSKPIPGNLYSIDNIINKLKKMDAKVKIDTSEMRFHTSGHASQEEQKIILTLLKPKYFLPVHGEYRMLKIHAQTATSLGIDRKNIFIIPNGQQLNLFKHKITLGKTIPADPVFIGGDKNDSEGLAVLNERQALLTNGLVNVVCIFDRIQKKLVSKPRVITRGVFNFANDEKFQAKLRTFIRKTTTEKIFGRAILREKEVLLTKALAQFFYREKKINPLLKVVVLE